MARRLSAGLTALLLAAAAAGTAQAQIVSRESEIVGLRLGQKVLVDDAACPAGQIKQVTGTKLLPNGSVARVAQCVDRKSARR